ncbi:hypothetical protein ACFO7V_09810 [Glutamicibacter bergerei]|uniref:Uncharacterized protein n=1 Tax=Glutamicibacter bergerei TaxID=256702 RepID=A0ABV9MNS5_9MICC
MRLTQLGFEHLHCKAIRLRTLGRRLFAKRKLGLERGDFEFFGRDYRAGGPARDSL